MYNYSYFIFIYFLNIVTFFHESRVLAGGVLVSEVEGVGD